MLSVEEALDRILQRVQRLGTERVELMSALGRVLAEPIVSRRQIPPWPNSSMDGYAVRATDTGSVELRVVGSVAAGGAPDRTVQRGEAVRIFTGAPLPEGADAVVPQEDVRAHDGTVRLESRVLPGAYVRPAGEDIRRGDRVLEAGRVLTAAEIGVLATLGYTQVQVYRRPRVAVLSTGDELADLGTEPGRWQIPNTNTYTLMAQILESGGEPINLGTARDDMQAIERQLRSGLDADMLLSSAGVSVGEHDLVRATLERLGAELHLWKVSMRPGKPITFGSVAGHPVFGLPGNPVSAMVTFELFVRPALRKMCGHALFHRSCLTARVLATIDNPGPRRGYLRVTLSRIGDGWGARLTGEQGSGILRSMVLADGLAVLPGDTTLREGDSVEVLVLRALA
jgi:molybdopterin molybdotransferase